MKKLVGLLEKVLEVCSLVFILFMIAVIILQVVTRILPVKSPSWTEEAARFLMIYMACFGGILAAGKKQFVRVDLLVDAFPERVRIILEILSEFLVGLFMLCTVSPAIMILNNKMMQKSPSLQITMAIPHTAIVVAIIGILLMCVKNIIEKLTAYRLIGKEDA